MRNALIQFSDIDTARPIDCFYQINSLAIFFHESRDSICIELPPGIDRQLFGRLFIK